MASALRCSALAAALTLGAASLLQLASLMRALRQTRRLVATAQRFERRPPAAARRALVLGDSTGLGVGAGSAAASIGGLLARDFPGLRVDNLARNGARVADVLGQLDEAGRRGTRYDLLLLLVGGNDVVRGSAAATLRPQVQRMLERSRALAGSVVWLGVANVGAAPAFMPPLSWWVSRRTRQLTHLFAAEAARQRVAFVDFFEERGHDRFSRAPQRYDAADGLHPSGPSYRHCYERAKREAGFDLCLGGVVVDALRADQMPAEPPVMGTAIAHRWAPINRARVPAKGVS